MWFLRVSASIPDCFPFFSTLPSKARSSYISFPFQLPATLYITSHSPILMDSKLQVSTSSWSTHPSPDPALPIPVLPDPPVVYPAPIPASTWDACGGTRSRAGQPPAPQPQLQSSAPGPQEPGAAVRGKVKLCEPAAPQACVTAAFCASEGIEQKFFIFPAFSIAW